MRAKANMTTSSTKLMGLCAAAILGGAPSVSAVLLRAQEHDEPAISEEAAPTPTPTLSALPAELRQQVLRHVVETGEADDRENLWAVRREFQPDVRGLYQELSASVQRPGVKTKLMT